MLEFKVNDMTCNHCVRAITEAVKQVEPRAEVQVNLDSHTVRIAGADDVAAFVDAIRRAGYSPVARG